MLRAYRAPSAFPADTYCLRATVPVRSSRSSCRCPPFKPVERRLTKLLQLSRTWDGFFHLVNETANRCIHFVLDARQRRAPRVFGTGEFLFGKVAQIPL